MTESIIPAMVRLELEDLADLYQRESTTEGYINRLLGELRRANDTHEDQQTVLDQIAAALGVEVGDVEGIGREIEGLKRDAARYRFLRGKIVYSKHGPSLPCGYVSADRRIEMAAETDTNIDKALAAGEAG